MFLQCSAEVLLCNKPYGLLKTDCRFSWVLISLIKLHERQPRRLLNSSSPLWQPGNRERNEQKDTARVQEFKVLQGLRGRGVLLFSGRV